jgi:hypothetical protein
VFVWRSNEARALPLSRTELLEASTPWIGRLQRAIHRMPAAVTVCCSAQSCRVGYSAGPNPSGCPSPAAAEEPQDEQRQDGTDGGVDDRADYSDAKMGADLRQQPIAGEGSHNADKEVAEEAEAGATLD